MQKKLKEEPLIFVNHVRFLKGDVTFAIVLDTRAGRSSQAYSGALLNI